MATVELFAQSPRSLFRDDQPVLQNGPSSKRSVRRSRIAKVDRDFLQQLRAGTDTDVSCRIQLFDGTDQVAALQELGTSDEHYRVLAGTLAGQRKSEVILVTDGKRLAGAVQNEAGDFFRIAPNQSGDCEVSELAAPTVPMCGVPPKSRKTNLPGRTLSRVAKATSSEPREIELMMLYTTQSRVMAGDVDAMEAQVRLSVEEANSAMANSSTGVRFHVVHTAEIPYVGSGDLALDLERLWSAADPTMADVRAWRDLYKADLVCLVVERWQSSIGVGYFATGPNDGYSVVAMDYLTGYYCVAHELGHNLGCDHDRENAAGGGAFPYSYGYRFDAGGSTSRTVMSYYPGTIIPYYSSPDVTFDGVPIGVAEGAPDAADNAQTIRQLAAFVDSYRGVDVQLTQPADGDSFSGKQPIVLAAAATTDEGPLVSVEFLDGDSVLGESTAAPYNFQWINPAPGRHEVSARTHIDGGGDVLSAAVVIGVGPANDNFADRAPLSGSNAVASAILYAATSEAAEPSSVRSAGESAWWSWVAPQDGVARVSASAAPGAKIFVSVFSGGELDQLQPVQSSRSSNRDMLFHATAGVEYEICVAGGAAVDPVSLYLTMQDPPANDDFRNAQLIDSASGTIQGSTVAATAEPGEPSIGLSALGHSVWFLWIPPISGQATVSLAPGPGTADFAIYSGTNPASLTLVANSTDAGGGFFVEGQQRYYIGLDGEFQAFSLSFDVVKPAVNDSFSKRISAASGMLTINPATATREPNEPMHGAIAGGHSQWWSWRSSSNGGVRMTRLNSGTTISPNLSVAWYVGNALTNLTRVASCDFTNVLQDPFVLPVRGGTNYAIALESGDGPGQSIRLEFTPLVSDHFNQRRTYISGNAATGTTLGATRELNEPDHAGEPAAHSVWWTWASPATRIVLLNVDAASELLPRVSVYSGTVLTNLVLIGENSTNGRTGPNVGFQAKAGMHYSFAIDETISSFNYSLTLQVPSVPANDNFDRAQPLPTQAQSLFGSTVDSSLEPGEPEHFDGDAAVNGSVWYTWVSLFERDVTILAQARRVAGDREQRMQTALPEPIVAVYRGASPGSLTKVDSGIGSATFRAVRNAQYGIAIASFEAQEQDFTLSILTVPSNDAFENALPLSGNSTVSPIQLRSATRQVGEPNHAGEASGHSLWWSWMALESGLYVWRNDPNTGTVTGLSPISLVTAVYTGADLGTLTVVASNVWSTLTFPAEAGQRYYLALDLKDQRIAFSGSNPTLKLSVSRYPVLVSPLLQLDRSLEFSIVANSGQILSVETSSDLIHWVPARQLSMPGSSYHYSEPSSLLAARKFFRLHLVANGGVGFEQ